MVTVILNISSRQGFKNLKRNIISFESDLSLGLDYLIFVSEDLYLEVRDYCQKIFNPGECLVMLDGGDFSEKECLTDKNEFVFILNEVIVVPSGTITELYRVFLEENGVGLVTGVFGEFPVMYWVEDFYSDIPERKELENKEDIVEVDTCPAYGIFTKTDLYKELYLQTKLTGYGGMSYGIRLKRLGYTNYLDKRVVYRYGGKK